jgi:hypothetical protein
MIRTWQELTKLTHGSTLVVKEVSAPDLGITIRGEFDLPHLAELSLEDQIFVEAFLKTQGSIKEMEQLFGVSYPTIKNRLARINEKLQLVDVNPPESRQEVLEMLERGEISAAEAVERLKK